MSRNLLILCIIISSIYGKEIVKLAPGQSQSDIRQAYTHKLLEAALNITVKEYGPYEITYAKHAMNRNRSLVELVKGEVINVHEAATRAEWEEKALPIRIPTRKGLLGYRIFLIRLNDSAKFSSIDTVTQIKTLKAGLRAHWSITKVMDTLGFNIVTSPTYAGLFPMLDYNRFDYFSRGINEVFDEYEIYKDSFPDLIIEPSLAMYIATPSYFFVSPQKPKLHQRIKRGLELLITNGVFDSLFTEHHKESISRANLQNRKIFSVTNPLLTKETPLDSLHFWHVPKGVKQK